jgi:hypothetical protein
MTKIVSEIAALAKKAKKNNMVPSIRMNGTSDIAWEKIAVKRDGKVFRNVMEAFPDIQFYDYTKILGRKLALGLPNYHLTFSLSEENDDDAIEALDQGYNVAVVVNIKPKAEKPAMWGGYPAVNGDENDIRFRDPKGGHIVLLTAKGEARKNITGNGFVRLVDGGFKRKQLKLKMIA